VSGSSGSCSNASTDEEPAISATFGCSFSDGDSYSSGI